MRRSAVSFFLAAMLVLSLSKGSAFAQTRQPAQVTTNPTLSPQRFDLTDRTGNLAPFGYVDPTTHAFQAIAGGVALSSFGAVSSPTGTPADASAALTAAVNYVNGRPIPIIIDGRYGLTEWVSNLPFELVGSNNSMRTLQQGAPPTAPCKSGFVNLSGATATLIKATGLTASIRGLCIEMASAPGTQTAGDAISLFSTGGVTASMTDAKADNNTIYYPFNGITTDANNSGQNLYPFIRDNSIIQPSGAAIGIGLASTCGACGGNGVRITGNTINCNGTYGDGGALGNSKSVGIWIASGAPIVDQNSPYRCTVGTKVVAALPGQVVSGSFSGWLGDTAPGHELEIGVKAGCTGCQVLKTTFDGWYVGQTNYGNIAQPIYIYNKGSAGSVHSLVFSGGEAHDGGGTGGAPVNPFWLVEDDVNKLTIVGNQILNDGAAAVSAIKLTGSGTYINITGNSFNGNAWAKGVEITGSGDLHTIVGNDFAVSTVPISWSTLNKASTRAIIRANSGAANLFEYNGPVISVTTTDANNTYVHTYGDNTNGLITMTGGAAPGVSGNVKLTFNRTATNGWTCTASLGLGTPAAWQAAATVKVVPTTNAVNFYWYNNGVAAAVGSVYQIYYSGCAQQ